MGGGPSYRLISAFPWSRDSEGNTGLVAVIAAPTAACCERDFTSEFWQRAERVKPDYDEWKTWSVEHGGRLA